MHGESSRCHVCQVDDLDLADALDCRWPHFGCATLHS